ncbi:MAG: aminoglycoside phosphotransferase family protein, partial [Desulfobacterota bacterium]|nr:aminoglycoside phosphotransferase family protein [Thermodesulfobacteriota bacterium]
MTATDIERLQQYIAHTVLPRIGMAGRCFELAPAKLGERNRVFYLTVEERPSFVIKAFTSKTRIQNTMLGSRFLLRYGIAAPRVYFSDTSTKTFTKLGSYVLCEERISGVPVQELGNDPETIKAVASYFTNLHRLRSSRWGSFRSGRRFGFTAYMLRKAKERIRILEASGTAFPDITSNALIRWFERRQAAFSAVGDYSLCHGDVNPANIMITIPERRVMLIDTEALKYLPFLLEYFRLQFFLCRDDAAAALFEQRYFDDAPPDRKRSMDRYGTVYRAFALLEFAWYYNKKTKQHRAHD